MNSLSATIFNTFFNKTLMNKGMNLFDFKTSLPGLSIPDKKRLMGALGIH